MVYKRTISKLNKIPMYQIIKIAKENLTNQDVVFSIYLFQLAKESLIKADYELF